MDIDGKGGFCAMKRTFAVLLSLGLGIGTLPASALARVAANVPVDSHYYETIDKLSGMGYLSSLPNGARPYSRLQMARWALEARERAGDKPLPGYLAADLADLEKFVAPELASLQDGQAASDGFQVRNVRVGTGYLHSDRFSYGDRRTASEWAPFAGNNGHKKGRNGSLYGDVEASGNLGHEVALGIRGRAAWDKDNEGTASLEEAYVKTRTGAWAWEAGKQAMTWGQGASGNLLLGNGMKPLTTIQAHLNEPIQAGGFLKFLGQVDFHGFYGRLDGDRAADAAAWGRKDYDHAGLLGLRLDVTPASWFTLGMSRISLLGGHGNGLDSHDWGKWTYGHNADSRDKWDDIGGFDFRVRLPGVQFYGEMYGEDQAHGMPSDWGYRGGVYLPQLTRDGSWDLVAEMAHTNQDWYVHGTYQDGWTYSGDMLGDWMGNDARKYYARVNHYFPGADRLGLYYQRTEKDRGGNGPVIQELGLTGRKKLKDALYLNGTLGYAAVKQGNKDHALFAGAEVEWEM